jgi:hypothetical protein
MHASGHESNRSAAITPLLVLRELEPVELNQAAQLLGRGLGDNPVNVRAFGIEDGERRSRALARFFVAVLQGLHQRGLMVAAPTPADSWCKCQTGLASMSYSM